ncbi:MAG: hypothetical protein IJE73_08190 [Muribaculaceae bacterium]|nr:hypothetical protein [Muribaculaceae bacterium]
MFSCIAKCALFHNSGDTISIPVGYSIPLYTLIPLYKVCFRITITATANDGSGASASCVVTVGVGGIEGVETDDNAVEVTRYDIHGRLLSEPARGINIIKMSDGTTRKEIVK